MKIITLSLIVFLVSGSLCAQTTRKVVDDEKFREVYYVLKSDKKIKEGPYLKHELIAGPLVCEGFYKNNQMDGLWKYYFKNSSTRKTGNYKEGKKIGIWYVYNLAGEVELEYNYTNKTLLGVQYNAQKLKQDVINGRDTISTFLDRDPINLDAPNDFYNTVVSNIKFPYALKNNVRNVIVASFTIDTAGTPSNYRIKRGMDSEFDGEVLRALRLCTTEWLPGILKGKPVAVEYPFTLTFTLKSEF